MFRRIVPLTFLLCASVALAYDRAAIDDCVGQGGSFDYQFGSCDMKRAHPGSSSTCVQELPGRWRVVGHLSPGVSALSDAEVEMWKGSVLILQPDSIQFRSSSCATPSFRTRELGADEFAESYRASASSLGMTAAEVCVTEVTCNGVWNEPGSLLVHGRGGKLFLFWDGVFFELRRN